MFSFPSKVYLRTNVYILFINKKEDVSKRMTYPLIMNILMLCHLFKTLHHCKHEEC